MVLWCQPNNTFMKIIDFVIIFESQKMSFGVHQSTTYGNSPVRGEAAVRGVFAKPNQMSKKGLSVVLRVVSRKYLKKV